VTALLREKLATNRRAPDGKLHSSGALVGSLRHLQLEAAGAPTIDTDLVSEVNLSIGTALHTFFEDLFRGLPVMTEVKLDPWMPEGWSGTADWVMWDADLRGFVLGDLKSCKPTAIPYLLRGGSKESQIWQASSYWHALSDMGIPLVDRFCIYHLPKNQNTAREGSPVEPLMNTCVPVERTKLYAMMAERKALVDEYLRSVPPLDGDLPEERYIDEYLTDKLAPVQDREIQMTVNKTLKRPVIDVKLKPNWSTAYCSFPDELCDCRRQGTNKIGSWDLRDDGSPMFTATQSALDPALVPIPDPALIAALVAAQKTKETP
jgi:hypothetical protein